MDNKRPLSEDEVIPRSPQVQILKRSRTLRVAQVVNEVKTPPVVDVSYADFFADDDFEWKENLGSVMSNSAKPMNNLDLATFQRCFIEKIVKDQKTHDVILSLKQETSELRAQCRLKIPWTYSKISENQLISVQGVWSDNEQAFIVSKDAGILVTFPDTLISGTSVVGSLFCSRKALLASKFMGIDSNNKIMTIGSIVHEILQTVLRKKLHTLSAIKQEVASILNTHAMVKMLYACEMSLEEIQAELQLFTDQIFKFVKRYVQKDGVHVKDDNFAGQIDNIQDIEENLWCPNLGMKGKIDVTVQDGRRSVLPLELKTGRASFSMEHRGQLIIYQMMLNQIGTNVDSGLLLYLREGVMKAVPATRHEQRDLVMLRNELAYFLTRKLPKPDGSRHQLTKNFEILELPEPINSGRICEKCPYNTICCTYLQKDRNIQLPSDHPLRAISTAVLSHLKPEHIEYFIHWTGLLSLEEEEGKKENHLKQIWTEPPATRYKRGRALINLEISGEVIQPSSDQDRYTHVFTIQGLNFTQLSQKTRERVDFTLLGIDANEYMVVSTSDRIAVAAGFVCDISSRFITMALERDLSKNYRGCTFHIDKYDSQSLMTFNFTNLGVLLDNCESAEKLRRIIIEAQPPTADRVLPKSLLIKGADILKELNQTQQRAVLSALASKDYSLLKGLPGTGKTQTLVGIIRLFLILKKTILITSHTHSAVDNLLVRLMDYGVKFLRLGAFNRINSTLSEYSEKYATAHCKSPEELDQVYKSYDIVATTCFGAAHPLLIQRKFDVCLVDEATQVMQCSVIRPLLSAQTFVLVGDPNQLPPVIKSREAKALGADESLFARLQSVGAPKSLTHQYRMNKTINQLANQLTYGGELVCANDTVASATIRINHTVLNKQFTLEKWLLKSLSAHVEQSVILLDTGNMFERSQMFGSSLKNDQTVLDVSDTLIAADEEQKVSTRLFVNYCEAAITFYLINGLLQAGVSGSTIGVVAPYRAQVELLKKVQQQFETKNQKLESYKGVEVNTVDQYQGRDKDIIIYSCTKSDNPANTAPQSVKENEILEDKRRLTVAITRAKHKLIILSDVVSIEKYTPFKEMFSKMVSGSKIKLEEGRQGFAWEWVLQQLEDLLDESSENTFGMMDEA